MTPEQQEAIDAAHEEVMRKLLAGTSAEVRRLRPGVLQVIMPDGSERLIHATPSDRNRPVVGRHRRN